MLTWVDFGLACSEQRAVVAAVFDNLAFSTRQSALRGALRAFHSGMTSHKSFRMLVPPGGVPLHDRRHRRERNAIARDRRPGQ